MASVPAFGAAGSLEGLDNTAIPGLVAPPTPHLKSGRRLSKSVARADSQDAEGSKGWGMVSMREGATERAVRVVQKAEAEDFNMYKVSWVFADPSGQVTWQIDLRHGRRSGIRKIYVNKELIERHKETHKLIVDTGSTHSFDFGASKEHNATIVITSKGMSGYTYQLLIDDNPIEQNVMGPSGDGSLDLGTRPIQLPKSAEGLGMSLRNNPLGTTGVVVWTLEEGKAAQRAGIMVGDVVLSIEDHIVANIDHLVEYAGKAKDVVNMELAGSSASRVVVLTKREPVNGKAGPIGLGLQTTSCGVGILVTEIDKGSAAAESELSLGDAILSVDGVVPKTPRHAVELIIGGGKEITFVVIGNAKEVY